MKKLLVTILIMCIGIIVVGCVKNEKVKPVEEVNVNKINDELIEQVDKIIPNIDENLKVGGSGVIFDAASSDGDNVLTDPWTWTHVVGASLTNSILLVGIEGNPHIVNSIDFNGDAMTLATSTNHTGGDVGSIEIYYLLNPDAGSHTITVDFNAGVRGSAGAVSFSNVDQTDPIDSDEHEQGTGTESNNYITTTYNNEYLFDVLRVDYFSASSYVASTTIGQIEYFDTGSLLVGEGGGSYKKATSSGSNLMQWKWTGTDAYTHLAIALKPADEGGTPATSCTAPVSGDWYVQASDNCYVSANTTVQGTLYIINTKGPGTFNVIDGAILSVHGIKNTSTPIKVETGSKINFDKQGG